MLFGCMRQSASLEGPFANQYLPSSLLRFPPFKADTFPWFIPTACYRGRGAFKKIYELATAPCLRLSRGSFAGTVLRSMNCAIASAGIRTARPQFTRGSFPLVSQLLTVEILTFNASAVSATVSKFFICPLLSGTICLYLRRPSVHANGKQKFFRPKLFRAKWSYLNGLRRCRGN